MVSNTFVHIIGTIATLTIFLVVSVFFVTYITMETQNVISNQLNEVSAKVASDIVDMTVLATATKSENIDMMKILNIPATVNNQPYSISLTNSNGVWEVVANLDVTPSISGEATLTWNTNSPMLNVVQGSIHVGSPVIAECSKTTVGGNAVLTVQLMQG